MPLDPDNLWIGDFLKSKTDGLLYRFEGSAEGGHLKVSHRGYEMTRRIIDFEDEVIDPATVPTPKAKTSIHKTQARTELEDTIDLHIRPEDEPKVGNWPGAEVHFQKQRCKHYLVRAQKQNLHRVTIIHGKGVGALREEVITILDAMDGIKSWTQIHEGAIEVYF